MMITQKQNSSRLAARLNHILSYMKAMPKLTVLVHLLVVLIIASTIGGLNHSGKSRQTLRRVHCDDDIKRHSIDKC